MTVPMDLEEDEPDIDSSQNIPLLAESGLEVQVMTVLLNAGELNGMTAAAETAILVALVVVVLVLLVVNGGNYDVVI